MVNKCCFAGCFSNYFKRDVVLVLLFPVQKELRTKWIKFVNRLNWVPTKSSVICAKHFQEKYLKYREQEKRFRLIKRLKAVTTVHLSVLSKSSIPTINLERKSQSERIYQNDQRSKCLKNDLIKNLNCIVIIPCQSG
nr:THAP domain-containing protein 2-like [Hydra vulgaris]